MTDRACRKCSTELTEGENWRASSAGKRDYICIECKKAYDRQYRVEHREELLAYDRQYRAEHREQGRAYNRQWREEHQEERREQRKVTDREYRQAHRTERTAYQRQWYHENLERACRNARGRNRLYRARKRGAKIGEVDEQKLFALYGEACIYCGAKDNLTLDHVVALNAGGPHCEDNLVVACLPCNSSKQDKPLEDWLCTRPRAIVWVQ